MMEERHSSTLYLRRPSGRTSLVPGKGGREGVTAVAAMMILLHVDISEVTVARGSKMEWKLELYFFAFILPVQLP